MAQSNTVADDDDKGKIEWDASNGPHPLCTVCG
jgi:hypothetical protein